MKKTFLFILLAALVSTAFAVIKNFQAPSLQRDLVEGADREYLKKVLANLSKIKSVSYIRSSIASDPGDTAIAGNRVYHIYTKEYVNPKDTIVGVSILAYTEKDSTKIEGIYDGSTSVRMYRDNNTILVDSFQNYPYPLRLLPITPFYATTTNLIKYILETDDSIKVNLKDYGDSVKLNLTIIDKGVDFVPKKFLYNNPEDEKTQYPYEEFSKYEVWISKADHLPYRLKREMPHQTSYERTRNPIINTTNHTRIVASNYYPKGFAVKMRDRNKPKPKSSLEGKTAADWTLKDAEGNPVTLGKLRSKVIVLQFTGIGCAPCHVSLPFLKQLVTDYKGKSFDLVGIETWSGSMEKLKRYKEKNGINYKFLKSDSTIVKNYGVEAVPVFLVLDEKRVIRKVINGYGKGTTELELKAAVNYILSKSTAN